MDKLKEAVAKMLIPFLVWLMLVATWLIYKEKFELGANIAIKAVEVFQ